MYTLLSIYLCIYELFKKKKKKEENDDDIKTYMLMSQYAREFKQISNQVADIPVFLCSAR